MPVPRASCVRELLPRPVETLGWVNSKGLNHRWAHRWGPTPLKHSGDTPAGWSGDFWRNGLFGAQVWLHQDVDAKLLRAVARCAATMPL